MANGPKNTSPSDWQSQRFAEAERATDADPADLHDESDFGDSDGLQSGSDVWFEPGPPSDDVEAVPVEGPVDDAADYDDPGAPWRADQDGFGLRELGFGQDAGSMNLRMSGDPLGAAFESGAGRSFTGDPSFAPLPPSFGDSAPRSGMGLELMGPEVTAAENIVATEVLAIIDALPTSWALGSTSSVLPTIPTEQARATISTSFSSAAPTSSIVLGAAVAAETSNFLSPVELQTEAPTGDAFLDQMASATALEREEEQASREALNTVTTRADEPEDDPDPALLNEQLLIGEDNDGNTSVLGAIASGAPTGTISSGPALDEGATTSRLDTVQPLVKTALDFEEDPVPEATEPVVDVPAPAVDADPVVTEEEATGDEAPVELTTTVLPEAETEVETEVVETAPPEVTEPTEPTDDGDGQGGTDATNEEGNGESQTAAVESVVVDVNLAEDGVLSDVGELVDDEVGVINEGGEVLDEVEVADSSLTTETLALGMTDAQSVSYAVTQEDSDELALTGSASEASLHEDSAALDDLAEAATDGSEDDDAATVISAVSTDGTAADGGVAYPAAGSGVDPGVAAIVLEALAPYNSTGLENLETAVLDQQTAEEPVDLADESAVSKTAPAVVQPEVLSDLTDVGDDLSETVDHSDDGGFS